MAIVQISQVKHRRGLQEDLPQLASAELGWSIDTRRLFIGNGGLDEGAPETGNTEILTEYSNIPGVTSYTQTLDDNTANVAVANMVFDSTEPGVMLDYRIDRAGNVRVGSLRISQLLTNLGWDEEYTETNNIGITFNVYTISSTYAQVTATTSSTGVDANLTFTVNTISL
jgi:hypothetical protein